MKLSDFNFDLPEDLIALRPARPRPSSRLLVAKGAAISDHHFADLPDFLRPGDLLVLNDTKVIPARLSGQRRRFSDQGETFASVEITLLSADKFGDWLALAKPGRRVRAGETIVFSDRLSAEVLDKSADGVHLRFSQQGAALDRLIAELGAMPLPPYIASKRPADAQDKTDYQTVFAREPGAVAAPTASLHFDLPLLEQLREMGVNTATVTLHVGAGTFLPVKTDDVSEHRMHAEWGEVTAEAAKAIAATKASGGRVISVGTTALRLIESAALQTGLVTPWVGETDIFIKPGFQFAVTDGLITNFHLPKSTLMILVAALMGRDRIRDIYAHAVTNSYRFFSYGDGSLLLPELGNDA
ncbi:MAG: tRNA preQ1(34) S-adenosylmethionine ribosyltransferase-isomerase QueA [Rhodobacteraceae bacterium]|nr:tRNA preQ1(34) S-adenosylmethionine ribosyltransferase-isomerase QueA [Paracoccaceae bacterium]